MINVALVLSLRGLPLMAIEGFSMFFYLLFASLLFLIPVSLVSAELATGWPEEGGVYRWVKEAFGTKWGFVAIWIQWVQNTIWYSTVLAFASGALAYLFLDPELANNSIYTVVLILAIYWTSTFVNFKGVKLASKLTTYLVILGTILPATLIIFFGFIWVFIGEPIQILQTNTSFLPTFSSFTDISFLAGTILLFAGMEVAAVHVNEIDDPKKNYPKAIFLAMVVILIIFTLGSFSIAVCLSPDQISLTAGIMQAFHILLADLNLSCLSPVIGFFVALGAIGGVVAWIGGPSKGLLVTAKHGMLPPFLQYVNDNGVQTHILWVQGAIVTILSLVFLLMPNVSGAFFLLTALTVVLYLFMYLLLYAAVIRLRYTRPDQHREYKIPGGNFGMWLVAGVGFLAALFALFVGFFPPAQLETGSPTFYVLFIVIGVVVFIGAPLLLNKFKKPEWKKD